MQVSFNDLVGTALVPAHCFDSEELSDLAPALDAATNVHYMTAQASEAESGSCHAIRTAVVPLGPCSI